MLHAILPDFFYIHEKSHMNLDFFTGFNNLSLGIKTISLAICIKIPFWYLGIQLFAHSFIERYPFYVQLVAAFCLTVTWLYGLSMAYFLLERPFRKTGETRNQYDRRFYRNVTTLGVPVLSTSIFLSYLVESNFRFFICVTSGMFIGTFGFLLILKLRAKFRNRHIRWEDIIN